MTYEPTPTRKHSKIVPLDVSKLQAIADEILPGHAVVTAYMIDEVLWEEDKRRGHEGENKLAIKHNACVDCNATGESTDADGCPTCCATCDGRQYEYEDPTIEHPWIRIHLGYRTFTEIGQFDHVAGVPKMRKDLFAVRDQATMEDLLREQLGNACFENAKTPHGDPDILHEHALAFLQVAAQHCKRLGDPVANTVHVDPDKVRAHVMEHHQRRVDAQTIANVIGGTNPKGRTLQPPGFPTRRHPDSPPNPERPEKHEVK